LAVEVLGLGVAVRGHMERRAEPHLAAEPKLTGGASRR
jgi:hypothetical protein